MELLQLQPPFLPMEPTPCSKPLDDDDYVSQIKWDGVRMLLFYDGSQVRLQNRRLHDRTSQYPELQSIKNMADQSIVLDGEIVAFKEGKPHFPTIMRRDAARDQQQALFLMKRIPIAYQVFDILQAGSQKLLNKPWEERDQILRDVLDNSTNPFYIVDNLNNGLDLFENMKELQMEGIVQKHVSSPYLSGSKSKSWLKIKHRPRITCYIGGYTTRGHLANSLLLGLPEDEHLLYLGRAGSGLKESEWIILSDAMNSIRIDNSPFKYPPRIKESNWVKPLIQVEVEYAEWTEETKLRAPVIKSIVGVKV
ncbi:MAG: DNA ligase [Candidatus Saccharibacteria bacterium]